MEKTTIKAKGLGFPCCKGCDPKTFENCVSCCAQKRDDVPFLSGTETKPINPAWRLD